MDVKPSNYTDFNDVNRLRLEATTKPNAALAPAAQKFEAVFIQMMLKSMRASVPQENALANQDMQTYQQMLDGQYALNLADHGGIGLAKVITQQVSRQAEHQAIPISTPVNLPSIAANGLTITPVTSAPILLKGSSQAAFMSIGMNHAATTSLQLQLQRSASQPTPSTALTTRVNEE